jgi:hypothetical protein
MVDLSGRFGHIAPQLLRPLATSDDPSGRVTRRQWQDQRVRLTEFWRRMQLVFGEEYAESWARDVTLADLDSRTAAEALQAGVPAKQVWRAVCQQADVPAKLR